MDLFHIFTSSTIHLLLFSLAFSFSLSHSFASFFHSDLPCRLGGSAKWQRMARSETFTDSGVVVPDVWGTCLYCANESMERRL